MKGKTIHKSKSENWASVWRNISKCAFPIQIQSSNYTWMRKAVMTVWNSVVSLGRQRFILSICHCQHHFQTIFTVKEKTLIVDFNYPIQHSAMSGGQLHTLTYVLRNLSHIVCLSLIILQKVKPQKYLRLNHKLRLRTFKNILYTRICKREVIYLYSPCPFL